MEEKKVEGKIESYEVAGQTKDGNDWYRIKIDGRSYSTFEDPVEFRGKYVEVTYTERENPKNDKAPFKNVTTNGIKLTEQEQTAETRPKANGNRSFALSYAKDMAVAEINNGKEITMEKVLAIAEGFRKFMDGEE